MHRNARCVGIVFAAYFTGRLQHSTVNQLSSSVFRFSFPLHFTCLAVKSKEQNGTFVMCTPSCDVIEPADSASRVLCELGSNTCLFLA